MKINAGCTPQEGCNYDMGNMAGEMWNGWLKYGLGKCEMDYSSNIICEHWYNIGDSLAGTGMTIQGFQK